METKPQIPANCPPFHDPTLYRGLVGSLQYLTSTRLDLSFAVNWACQHTQQPSEFHFTHVKRILRYVKGTLSYGQSLSAQFDLNLTAFANADWARFSETRRSTSDFCTFLGKNCLSWTAKKQPTVSQSSTEVEY